jgi:hypothetical protein
MIRYIFSANPGRAGSGYLSVLLKHAINVVAFHEPEPIMNRLPMIEFLNGRPRLMEALMPEKLASIRRTLTAPHDVYAETNHAFIRGFGWLLPNIIPHDEIGVILLRRDRDQVARSMYRIGVNAFNNGGRGWLIHANVKRKHVPLPDDIPFLLPRYYYYRLLHRLYYFAKARPRLTHGVAESRAEPRTPYEMNIKLLRWYVDEVYALAEQHRKTFPAIRYYEVHTEELNDPSKVVDMFRYFGLEPKASLGSVVGTPVNTKPEYKIETN